MIAPATNPKWAQLYIQRTTLPTGKSPARPVRADVARIPAARSPRDRVRGDIGDSPLDFQTPPPDSINNGMGNYFEALRDSKDRTGIQYATVHLNPQILRLLNGLNRKLLAAVGRYLVDNPGLAKYAVNQIANYSCPVKPRAQTGDHTTNQIYEDYFSQWERRADFTRRHTFEELQRICCIAIDVDGDIGATITDKNKFPQVRLFDTFHIGNLTGLDPKDGAEIGDLGELKGFWICDGPVDTLTSAAQTFVPVDQFFLMRDPERYNNYRGFSALRTGANDLRDWADIKAFTKTKEKIGAALAAVIQQNGPLEEDDWGDDTGEDNPTGTTDAQGNPISQMQKKLSLAQLFGGDIPVITGELKQFITQNAGNDTIAFLNFLAGCFVAGLDIPPAFFLDEKLTGPNVRAVLGKIQRKFDQRKMMIARFVEFCWLRVIGWGIANDGLPAVPNWWKLDFQFQPLMTIDLGDVMTNERADVLCGQMSERERFANRGKQWEHEHDQMMKEIETKLESAVSMQTKFKAANIPIEFILARMGFGTIAVRATLPPPPQEGETTDPNNGGQNNNDAGKNKEKK